MAGEGQVHWHEGLFLQPHHLEAMQRHLLDRLAADHRLGLRRNELGSLVSSPLELAGTAEAQVDALVRRVEEITRAEPEAAAYRPGSVL